MDEETKVSRRSVLHMALLGVAAACILSFIRPIIKYLSSNEDQLSSPLVRYQQQLNVGSDWKNITGTRVWVKRDELGYMAILATCTHLGCEVRFYPDKKVWRCPCHGSIYNSDGRPISGPAQKTLSHLAVTVKKDGLIIDTLKQVGMNVHG